MSPNPTPTTLITLCFGVSVFIFIMFLPALLELKKPKDAGPRRIMDDAYTIQPKMVGTIVIVNLEEEHRFDQKLVEKIMNIIAVLPNLEV